ncbi:MAG: hypothetical protein GY795_39245 [Desulfobacterales bacterium]|nr:hypothetical protein [Desulfobacterales bacterium]
MGKDIIEDKTPGNDKPGRMEGMFDDAEKQQGKNTPKPFLLSKNFPARISRRELALNMYLNREPYYQPPRLKDNSTVFEKEFRKRYKDQSDILTKRRLSAHLELVLINLVKCRMAPTLKSRCNYLEKVRFSVAVIQDILGSVLKSEDLTHAVEDKWKTMVPVFLKVNKHYAKILKNDALCGNKPPLSTLSVLGEIESISNDRIIKKLEKEVTHLIHEISKAQEELQALKKKTLVDPKTKELLKLEMDMGNAWSNLKFVSDDSFGLGKIVNELRGINFKKKISKIEDPKVLKEFIKKKQELENAMEIFFQELEKIKPYENNENVPCANLAKNFSIIVNETEQSDKIDDFISKYESCLNHIGVYMEKLSEPDRFSKINPVFLKYLEDLSDAMLIIVKGSEDS